MLSTNRQTNASKTATSRSQDATSLLKADHKLVASLFKDFEATSSSSKKKQLVDQICKELSIHAQVEEEIFYPAVQKATKDHELVPEAMVEHSTLKDLIAEVKGVQPNGDMYDAKVKVMSEYVKHHVKEEEGEMFPKAKETDLDLGELGAQLKVRKAELSNEYV